MSLHRFHRDTLAATSWKNGGGATREIACWPPGAGLGDFGWRVSIATIAASGPFSVFDGVDRQIMLLEGDGVRLRSRDGDIDHWLDTPHQPFAFRGEAAMDCTLLGAASSDFNVMTRRGQWQARLQVLDSACLTDAAPHGVLLALQGSWRLRGLDESGESGELGEALPVCQAGEGYGWTGADRRWHVEPQSAGAQLALVRLIPQEIQAK